MILDWCAQSCLLAVDHTNRTPLGAGRRRRAGPIIQQFFTLALASEGLAMYKSGEAPRSGLGFFSTCSCCLTWCCYGIAKMNPSIYLPNAAGFVVGTITTLLFVGLTEQRMGWTLLVMVAMAAAVLTLMFGGVMPAEEATQWTANIGILQAVVMLGSGCAVWPTVRCPVRRAVMMRQRV